MFGQGDAVVFQPENLVGGRLDGRFHVKLKADFYSLAYFHEASGRSAGELAPQQHAVASRQREFASRRLAAFNDKKYLYFDIQKGTERVHPLNKRRCSRQGPIEYMPSLRFRVTLPQVPHNITRLNLAVFASGNADEDFWYTNVFDKYKRWFKEDAYAFFDHSPLRYVIAWVYGEG